MARVHILLWVTAGNVRAARALHPDVPWLLLFIGSHRPPARYAAKEIRGLCAHSNGGCNPILHWRPAGCKSSLPNSQVKTV